MIWAMVPRLLGAQMRGLLSLTSCRHCNYPDTREMMHERHERHDKAHTRPIEACRKGAERVVKRRWREKQFEQVWAC